ncbi:MAG TPA: hypothetical protein VFF78_05595, partial [Anaerolineaceae bacterium]|nr:hypothetical protein [Anaerolineaceae bacterium]
DDSAVYMLVSIDNTPGSGSDGMIVYYVDPDNSIGAGGLKAVDLPAAKNWKIRDAPSLTAGSSWALAGFAAENTDHTGSEIYWFTYVAGAATAPTPTIPMSTALNDCDAVVALVDSMQSVGWHICGFPPTRDDVYFFSFADGPEGVIHSPASDFAGRGGLDMAANGDYVAGVWNEVQSDGRNATWLAYNSYMIWLPAISR